MKKIIAGIASAGMTAAVCFTAFAGTWKLDSRGWWYQNDNGTWPSGGWQKIQGVYYYFDSNGYMLADTVTPDGFYVDQSGAWVQNYVSGKKADEIPGMGTYYLVSDTYMDEITRFGRNSGSYITLSDNHDGTINMVWTELHDAGGTASPHPAIPLVKTDNGFWILDQDYARAHSMEGIALRFDGTSATLEYDLFETVFKK